MTRVSLICALCALLSGRVLAQDADQYAGAVVGVATLSADARTVTTASGIDVGLYKPENGAAMNLFWGRHVHEYVSLQANYIWNHNALRLTSVSASPDLLELYDQPRNSSQHAVIGDMLVYFRNRGSVLRPYLSGGIGGLRFTSREAAGAQGRSAPPPAPVVRSGHVVFRVAVGIDVAVSRHMRARYSFSESLSGNPISALLSPPGERNLANFQNLVGIVLAY